MLRNEENTTASSETQWIKFLDLPPPANYISIRRKKLRQIALLPHTLSLAPPRLPSPNLFFYRTLMRYEEDIKTYDYDEDTGFLYFSQVPV